MTSIELDDDITQDWTVSEDNDADFVFPEHVNHPKKFVIKNFRMTYSNK